MRTETKLRHTQSCLSKNLKPMETQKRQSGSHRVLEREGWPNVVFAFHDREEIGPTMLARIARRTGLTADDL